MGRAVHSQSEKTFPSIIMTVNIVPDFLFRVFNNEAHAVAFLEHGVFRLTLLAEYKKIGYSSRQDSSEGKAHIRIPGGDYHEELGNPCYVMCTSGPAVDLRYIRNKFGNFVVKILEPEMLLQDIKNLKPVAEIIDYNLLKVEYSKGLAQNFNPQNRIVGSKLSIYQKHPGFSEECEWRYVVTIFDWFIAVKPSYIYCDLKRKLSYLEKCW